MIKLWAKKHTHITRIAVIGFASLANFSVTQRASSRSICRSCWKLNLQDSNGGWRNSTRIFCCLGKNWNFDNVAAVHKPQGTLGNSQYSCHQAIVPSESSSTRISPPCTGHWRKPRSVWKWGRLEVGLSWRRDLHASGKKNIANKWLLAFYVPYTDTLSPVHW